MSLSRRGFLTSLFGASAAALLLPSIDLSAYSSAPTISPAIAEKPLWNATFKAAHRKALRLLTIEMEKRGIRITPNVVTQLSRMGDVTDDGIVMAYQRFVEVRGGDNGRTLEPGMASLAAALASRGIDRFGTMTLPPGCAYASMIGPLRMIVQYDLSDDLTRTRFDVLGGSSPEGLRLAQRYDSDMLKARIRRRLGTYLPPPRFVV